MRAGGDRDAEDIQGRWAAVFSARYRRRLVERYLVTSEADSASDLPRGFDDGFHDRLPSGEPLTMSRSPFSRLGEASGLADVLSCDVWPGQRSATGTSPSTLSTCRPQPANEGFPHFRQVMR